MQTHTYSYAAGMARADVESRFDPGWGYALHTVRVGGIGVAENITFTITDAQLTVLQEALTRAMTGRQILKGL